MNIYNYVASFYKTPIDSELESFIDNNPSLNGINKELLVGITFDSLKFAVPFLRQTILERCSLSPEDIQNLCEALQEFYHTENPF